MLLMAIQLLVLNYVYLGGYVMPMVYVLFILMLPTGMKRIPLLLVAFGTGLLVDVMNNMLGFHAIACTVLAMLRILFADRVLTRGEDNVVEHPSIFSVTPQYFISYLLLMLSIFYFIFFVAEMWGFRSFGGILLAVVCSTVVSALIMVLYLWVFLKKVS